jgi:hypothetical protein
MLNVKYNEVWRKRKILLTIYNEDHALHNFGPSKSFCIPLKHPECLSNGYGVSFSQDKVVR